MTEDSEETPIELPYGWSEIEEDTPTSTSAHYHDGFSHHDAHKVIIWRGVEKEDGGVEVESHLKEEVPPSSKYVVEKLSPGSTVDNLEDEKFASGEGEAYETAEEMMGEHNW